MGLFYDDCSYYQVKIPIDFPCRWKSNSKSLVQQEPLLVELIKSTKTFNNHENFLLLYITWPLLEKILGSATDHGITLLSALDVLSSKSSMTMCHVQTKTNIKHLIICKNFTTMKWHYLLTSRVIPLHWQAIEFAQMVFWVSTNVYITQFWYIFIIWRQRKQFYFASINETLS